MLGLVEAAGLAGQLNSAGPFTVFAPTDEAFAKIPNLDQIVSDMQTVIAILTNHVVGGVYTSDVLSDGQILKTIVGGDLVVSTTGNSIMINDATVVNADILGSNGVVHGIDSELPYGNECILPLCLPTLTFSFFNFLMQPFSFQIFRASMPMSPAALNRLVHQGRYLPAISQHLQMGVKVPPISARSAV